MARQATVKLEFQPYIQKGPIDTRNMYHATRSNDGPTMDRWKDIWHRNISDNLSRFGSFHARGLGKLHGIGQNTPVILAGSGPSLTYNSKHLKDRGQIKLISCLHNFHHLEDIGAPADYYVTLDAGEITVDEVSEGGSQSAEDYWKLTEQRTLLAYVGTSPRLLEKWRGDILFYNVQLPNYELKAHIESIGDGAKFYTNVSTGGNVLGSCFYIAKAIMGHNPCIFVGADFSFGRYDEAGGKFHGWNSSYDKDKGATSACFDVYGNKVETWPSYYGFKLWFEYVCAVVPGIYINATEGGSFGSYPDGNVISIIQMELQKVFEMYNLNHHTKEQCQNPEKENLLVVF